MRRVQLLQGLSALEHVFRAGGAPKAPLMERLVRGWGNEAWSAGAPFLCAMLDWLTRTDGPVLECGSGLSTLLLATSAAFTGRKVFALEHDGAWASLIAKRMPERLRSRVSLSLAPIRSYGEFDWYSLERSTVPSSVGYVVCDGPPAATRGGRYGLGPVIGPRMGPGTIILLDDTQRPEERAIVGRWCSELGADVVQEGGTYTVLRVRGGAHGG